MKLATQIQDIIEVEVAFYDLQEKQKLLAYPCGKQMEQLTAQHLQIPTAEFLAFYLFHRKRLGISAYRDYQALGRKTNEALNAIGECLDFNGHSLCTPAGAVRQLNEISEHVGEAIGLSVASRIHNFHEADWATIGEQHGRGAAPTFDFQMASDSHQLIQVENKGSSVDDNRVMSEPIRQQKAKITKKKNKLANLAKEGRDPFPAGLRYGTITAVDPRRDGRVKCWLADPPLEPTGDNARALKILQRMRFLRDWISLLAYRSSLAAALATRLADLEQLHDPFELDEVPILHGNGNWSRSFPQGLDHTLFDHGLWSGSGT